MLTNKTSMRVTGDATDHKTDGSARITAFESQIGSFFGSLKRKKGCGFNHYSTATF